MQVGFTIRQDLATIRQVALDEADIAFALAMPISEDDRKIYCAGYMNAHGAELSPIDCPRDFHYWTDELIAKCEDLVERQVLEDPPPGGEVVPFPVTTGTRH